MGVPVDDIVVLLMADYGVNLYGNAIIVNPKFAAEKPDAVKGFLRAFVKGLKDTVKIPATAVDSVIKRNDVAKKDGRARTAEDGAASDNIVTAEVKANGYGGVDSDRARQVDRPDRPDLRVQERASRKRPMCSTPRSCRRRPTARRTDSAISGAAVSALRRARWRQPRLWRRRRRARGRRTVDRGRGRRIRRRGRPVRLRQVHPDEARDRPAISVQAGTVTVAGEAGHAAGQDRRHGVPGADPAAVAHHARKPAAAARDRRAASQRNAAQARPNMSRARRESAGFGRPRRPGRANFPGSCPAACSSAPRSAAR